MQINESLWYQKKDIMTVSLPYIVTEYCTKHLRDATSDHYHTNYDDLLRAWNTNDHFGCIPFVRVVDDDDNNDVRYYNKIDIAIHIQEAMIENIQDSPLPIFEDSPFELDRLSTHAQIIYNDEDDMDYKKN